MSIFITGATGQLGRLVIQEILKQATDSEVIAIVRDTDKAKPLADLGVQLRSGDYNDPTSLEAAYDSAQGSTLLFISSPDSDDTLRIVQHAQVVKAARDAGFGRIAYTSFAFAESSPLPLAQVHLATEAMIKTTGIPYTFLRNPLYTELFINPGLAAAVAQGALYTNTNGGKLNTATREDLARAAAVALIQEGHENKTYTLASSQTWSYDELAAILSEVSGQAITHQHVTFGEMKDTLLTAGLPEPIAALTAGIYETVASGGTASSSEDLDRLIGTATPLHTLVQQSIKGA